MLKFRPNLIWMKQAADSFPVDLLGVVYCILQQIYLQQN